MKRILLTGAVTMALTTSPVFLFAQEKADAAEPKKEISIGSHVLKQKGDDEYSYKNEDYYYQKVWEVAGASKDELYKRVKNWIGGVTEAEVSRVNYDESDRNSISALFDIDMKGNSRNMDHEHITFKLTFSFKDGKVRLQGSDYRYHGDYDHGYKTRPIATGYGTRMESYRDANSYDAPLHNLKPMTKGMMRKIYEDFDARYLKIVRDMKKNVLNDAGGGNW